MSYRARLLLAICSSALCLTPLSVWADTIIVTNNNDSGPGSLRAAIAAAGDGDTIQFDPALKGQTITLTSDELFINNNLTITGPGPSLLTVKRSTAGGTPAFRIFHILKHTVTIEGLSITNGLAPGNVPGPGGGIFCDDEEPNNERLTVTVNNCIISGNTAGGGSAFGGGGGISFGAINGFTSSTLTVSDCTISNNTAAGGGFYGGGGIYIVVSDSTGMSSVTISNSTISGNSSDGRGGGIYNGGTSVPAMLTINNSTISGNTTATFSGGGIYNDGGFGGNTALRINNSTLSGNSANSGGAIYNIASFGGTAALDIGNTILNSGPRGGTLLNDGGTVTSHGYNLSSDDAGGNLNGPGDQINTDPVLGALQDNGGPTFTQALLPSSPAIDAGDPNLTPPPFFDQRGPGFNRVVNGRIDKGSFEVQAAPGPQYQIYDIGVVQVGDTASQGFGVSRAGIAVGRSLRTGGSQAFTWTLKGGIVGLPNLSGRSYAVSNSANDTGAVVGTAATTAFGSGRLPVIWQNRVVSQLPLPPGETLGDANSVNVSNVAVGSVDSGSLQRGVIYSGGSASIITQTTSNGSYFLTAFGINDSGRIVGQGIDPQNAARNVGIVYDIGQNMAFEVGALPGMNGALAFGVSNTGLVVGSSMLNQGSGLPFIWSDKNGIMAIPLAVGTTQGSARAVNSPGWVVGDDSSKFSIPFLYDGTTTYRLADLIPPNSGWDLSMNTSSSALGISEDGIIVGTGVHNGETHAYAMIPASQTPTPTPTPTPMATATPTATVTATPSATPTASPTPTPTPTATPRPTPTPRSEPTPRGRPTPPPRP